MQQSKIKITSVIILAMLAIMPMASAFEIGGKNIDVEDVISRFFSKPLTAFGTLGACGASADNDIQIDIANWQQQANRPTTAYIYTDVRCAREPCGFNYASVDIAPYKSHRGRIAWGGADFNTYLVSLTPLTDTQVKECIPGYSRGAEPVQEPAKTAKCQGKADLQIIDVKFNSLDAVQGKIMPLTVTLENQGTEMVFSEHVECGLYDSWGAYVKSAFPLALVKSVQNCVPTETNVMTNEIFSLVPGERATITLSPVVPDTKDVTLICGIYPRDGCGGAYKNECGNNKRTDMRSR